MQSTRAGILFLRGQVLKRISVSSPLASLQVKFAQTEAISSEDEHHNFQSATIGDILLKKADKEKGAWLRCTTDDTVYEAVKEMTSHNVGALMVVKAGSENLAGIITERDYLRKIIVQGRSSKETKVGDIMTEENKLITVTPETKLIRAMELMTENRIRHIPVCDTNHKMTGMVSVGDIVKAVVEESRAEVKRLNDYIQGSY